MPATVLKQIMDTPDKGIPEEVLDNAKCIVVVPHLIKAGFIFGGKHGRGVASCRTATGWSAPAFISVSGGSWGLQIGAEGVDLVMLVMNDKGLQHLLSSKFQLSGEGSAAAGPVGRHASAGTDWKMNAELLTYSRSKGAFAGLTLEGAVIEQDADSTTAIYGRDVGFPQSPHRPRDATRYRGAFHGRAFDGGPSGGRSRSQRRDAGQERKELAPSYSQNRRFVEPPRHLAGLFFAWRWCGGRSGPTLSVVEGTRPGRAKLDGILLVGSGCRALLGPTGSETRSHTARPTCPVPRAPVYAQPPPVFE